MEEGAVLLSELLSVFVFLISNFRFRLSSFGSWVCKNREIGGGGRRAFVRIARGIGRGGRRGREERKERLAHLLRGQVFWFTDRDGLLTRLLHSRGPTLHRLAGAEVLQFWQAVLRGVRSLRV